MRSKLTVVASASTAVTTVRRSTVAVHFDVDVLWGRG